MALEEARENVVHLSDDPVERFLQIEGGFDLVRKRYVRCRGAWAVIRPTPNGHRLWWFDWPHRDRRPTLLDAIALIVAAGRDVDEINPTHRRSA
jgi:hypothetical protein